MSEDPSGPALDLTLRDFAAGQKVFNRYTLIRTLGRGGMGIVWLAHDEVLDRDVALKFLPEIIIQDRAVLDDLKRETKRSLELTHKNIVRIHDFVHDIVSGCISMEYVEGDTLSNLRADQPSKIFEPDELKPWLIQLCDALDYAHNNARIIHRDLKPANLMINRRGDVKVADFGIARSLSDSVSMLTHARGTSGTLIYMSPQQLDGERGTHLDDIYSLGATIYELLTSKPPFYSGNIDRQIREKIAPSMTQRRRDLEIEGNPIPKNWEETVAACLAKDPAKRPQSMAEVAERLQLAPPRPTLSAGILNKRSKKKALVAMITTLLILFVVLSLVIGRRKVPLRQPGQAKQSVAVNSSEATDYNTALEYISGMNKVRTDDVKAIEHLRRAAGKHFPEAEVRLAGWTKYGLHGITKDSTKGEELARQSLSDGLEAAAKERATAQEALAFLYQQGLGVGKDVSKTAELYQKAAAQGRASAQTSLGILYETGNGVTKDLSKAAEWYQRAADRGDVYAQTNLGQFYQNGRGVEKDLNKAAELYQKAANQGFAVAQSNLGLLYGNGMGVDKDFSKAADLYQKGANQGYAPAQRGLAWSYETGNGVTRDPSKAAVWYQKAADQGDAAAQTNLGWLYENGTGVTKDMAKAAQLYENAVNQGYARAQNNLGILYETGRGVTKDIIKAAELYQKAADQNNTFAQKNLGVLYENGTGVPKDLNRAIDLYRRAADGGNEQAREQLRHVEQANSATTQASPNAAPQGEAATTKSSTAEKSKTRPLLRIWMKTLGDYLYETSGASRIPPLRSIDKGVVIFSIGLHGTDLKSPLQPFDVITQADSTPVTTSTEFWNAIDKKSADQNVELLVWRADHMIKVTVRPEDLLLAKSRGALQRGESQLATKLLEDAAGQGYPEAEAALGDLYSEGKLIRPDHAKAAGFYQKAADHNDPVGQYGLGVLYEQGKGVSQNLTTAIDLYKKAAQQGDAEAKKRLERIEAERQSTATAATPSLARPSAVPTVPSILKGTPPAPTWSEGTLRVDSTPWGLDFEVIDAKGNHRTGVTPAVVSLALGSAQVIFKNGNQEHRDTVSIGGGTWSSVGWAVPQESPSAMAQNIPSSVPTSAATSTPPVAGVPPGAQPAISVVQSFASAAPTQSAGRVSTAQIEDFVKQFVSVNQTPDVEKTLTFYSPKVDYFGDRGKDQRYIRGDIQKYNVQWPARRDSIDGDVHVEEKVLNQQYRANFKLNLYAENTSSSEWSKGEVAMTLDMNIIDGIPKIVAINQERLHRQNGRGKGPRPADMEPVGPIKPTKLTKVLVRKYGFSALVPTEIFPDAEAKLADGITDYLNSVKGCAAVTFSAPHENVRKVYDDYVNQFHAASGRRTIDYKVVKDTWFVVSGSSRTTGYYVKGVKHGDSVFVMQLEYAGAVCKIPAAMVTEMSRAFDGN